MKKVPTVLTIALSVLVSLFAPISALGSPKPNPAIKTYGSVHGFRMFAKPSTKLRAYLEQASAYMTSQKTWTSVEMPPDTSNEIAKILTGEKYHITPRGTIVIDGGITFILKPSTVIWDPTGKTKGVSWLYVVRDLNTKASMRDLEIFGGVSAINYESGMNPLKLVLDIPFTAAFLSMDQHTIRSLKNLPPYFGAVTIDFVNSKAGMVEISNPYLMSNQNWSVGGPSIPTDTTGSNALWIWFEQVVDS